MKLEAEYWIVVILMFILMSMALVGGCRKFVPYSVDPLFRKEYPFEGFSSPASVNGMPSCNGNYKSVNDTMESLDIFSKEHQSKEGNNNSGLTNSTGPMHLSKKSYDLLTSRGGNAKGEPVQI
tara:strand:- start:19 stop:387 length:369 start_codon:yes stop_codon:yes gene_type:complete